VAHRGGQAHGDGVLHQPDDRLELVGGDEIDRLLERLLEGLPLAEVEGLVLDILEVTHIRGRLQAVEVIDNLVEHNAVVRLGEVLLDDGNKEPHRGEALVFVEILEVLLT
jgi:hypothetical protein